MVVYLIISQVIGLHCNILTQKRHVYDNVLLGLQWKLTRQIMSPLVPVTETILTVIFSLTWERIDVDDSILLGLAVDDDVDANQTHIHGLTDGGPQLLQ